MYTRFDAASAAFSDNIDLSVPVSTAIRERDQLCVGSMKKKLVTYEIVVSGYPPRWCSHCSLHHYIVVSH